MRQMNLRSISKSLASASILGLMTLQPATADLFDAVPHLGITPIAVQLGDFTMTATGSATLGAAYEKLAENTEISAFAGGDLDLLIERKLINGTTVGAELRGSAGTSSNNAGSGIALDVDKSDQKAILFARGPWGKLDLGYLNKVNFSVKGSSTEVGLSSLKSDSISNDIYDLGMRYTTNYGPHTLSLAADKNFNVKGSYFFQRPFRAFNYTAGLEILFANKVALPAVSNRLARSLGMQGGLQVDYGRLYVAGGVGFETFRSKSDNQSENRTFGSLGISNKFGRTTVSLAASVSHLSEAKTLTTGLSLGGEFALSRGVTLVGGYNLRNARISVGGQNTNSTSHKLSAGLQLSF